MTDDIEKSNFNPQMLKSCTDTAYECGYRQGATDMEQAKQIIIDSLLKQIEQIRADAIEEYRQRLNNAFEPVEEHEQMELEVVIADVNRLANVLKEQK